ncbi:MAG: DUF1385 domain-containing protein [Clostridiaceae bacterium]|nr:DUF1385 domain-containing protein [Clostridiaceae bacterium]
MKQKQSERLGTVGGQAVLDGVMMKAAGRYAVSVRLADGSIHTEAFPFHPLSERCRLLALPLVRGCVNFFQMLALGQTVLTLSADAAAAPEERNKEPKTCGFLISAATWVFAAAISVGLFMFLPALLIKIAQQWMPLETVWLRNIAEGLIRCVILLGYLWLVSLVPDMRRTFEYHGAEHKTVACYEAGEPLTPENAMKFTRFHPRCGTSFLFVMILIGILFYSLPFFTWDSVWERVLTKLVFFPVIAGIGYEVIRFSGRHPENRLMRILTMPGLWLQRITTREPSAQQLAVAIEAVQGALSTI